MPSASPAPFLSPFEGERWFAQQTGVGVGRVISNCRLPCEEAPRRSLAQQDRGGMPRPVLPVEACSGLFPQGPLRDARHHIVLLIAG